MRTLHDYRYKLFINNILVDQISEGSFYYNNQEGLQEITTYFNFLDFLKNSHFKYFHLNTKKFGTFIYVGNKWIKKKDIKTIKIFKVVDVYTEEYINKYHIDITLNRLSKELISEEFKNYCIDNNLINFSK